MSVEYDYVGKQSIPTTGLSPASPTALWAAEPALTPRSRPYFQVFVQRHATWRRKHFLPSPAKGGKENGVLATVANRNETGRQTHTQNPRVRPSAIRHRNSDFTSMLESQVPASWAGLVRTPSMRIAPFSLTITAKTNGLSA